MFTDDARLSLFLGLEHDTNRHCNVSINHMFNFALKEGFPQILKQFPVT